MRRILLLFLASFFLTTIIYAGWKVGREGNNNVNAQLVPAIETHTPRVGGQRDDKGCLGPAGYSFNEEIGACTRTWELNNNTEKASKIVSDAIGQQTGLTIVEVKPRACPGCFLVEYEINGIHQEIELVNWKIKQAENS